MRQRILIVDDSSFMRGVIREYVESAGLNVVGEAESGIEAVKKYTLTKPDIVTMDITMPEMNGMDTIKEIILFDPQAKIIVCSAMGQERMVISAIKSGAKDFVAKPLQRERILMAIEQVISNQSFLIL